MEFWGSFGTFGSLLCSLELHPPAARHNQRPERLFGCGFLIAALAPRNWAACDWRAALPEAAMSERDGGRIAGGL
jgi:hypothetical protein